MVIEMVLGFGTATEKKIYRDVLPHRLAEYREGFFANKSYYQWGELWSLRGIDRTLLHKFGTKSQEKPKFVTRGNDFDESDEWKEFEHEYLGVDKPGFDND